MVCTDGKSKRHREASADVAGSLGCAVEELERMIYGITIFYK